MKTIFYLYYKNIINIITYLINLVVNTIIEKWHFRYKISRLFIEHYLTCPIKFLIMRLDFIFLNISLAISSATLNNGSKVLSDIVTLFIILNAVLEFAI